MKKRLLIIAGLLLTIAATAQGPWDGFFRPVDQDAILQRAEGDTYGTWLFRPAASMTAIQFIYDKEGKAFQASTFSSAGIGIGYQHYVEANGQPVNNYGFNALVILDGSQVEGQSAGVGAALTVNALKFVNLGAGYNFTGKQFFLLTGAVYNF